MPRPFHLCKTRHKSRHNCAKSTPDYLVIHSIIKLKIPNRLPSGLYLHSRWDIKKQVPIYSKQKGLDRQCLNPGTHACRDGGSTGFPRSARPGRGSSTSPRIFGRFGSVCHSTGIRVTMWGQSSAGACIHR